MGLEDEEGGFEISLYRLSFKHSAEGSETSIHPHITEAEQLLGFCGLCFRFLAPLHFCPRPLGIFFFLRHKTLQIPKCIDTCFLKMILGPMLGCLGNSAAETRSIHISLLESLHPSSASLGTGLNLGRGSAYFCGPQDLHVKTSWSSQTTL